MELFCFSVDLSTDFLSEHVYIYSCCLIDFYFSHVTAIKVAEVFGNSTCQCVSVGYTMKISLYRGRKSYNFFAELLTIFTFCTQNFNYDAGISVPQSYDESQEI
jgi:hypothetical protein